MTGGAMRQEDLHEQLMGYCLTTAEILYHMPDHPGLLQTFTWQLMDREPDYPRLRRFLDFWNRNLDGKLHSVRIANRQLVAAAGVRHVRHLH